MTKLPVRIFIGAIRYEIENSPFVQKMLPYLAMYFWRYLNETALPGVNRGRSKCDVRYGKPVYRTLFSNEELQILEYISDTFRNITANDIADISHQEPAWQNNIKEKKYIFFLYAFDSTAV